MTVFIMDPIDVRAVCQLAEFHDVVDYPESREKDWRADAEAIIVRTFEVRAADFVQAKKLRIIAKHGTGVDNIDIQAAADAGVHVTNTPGANAAAVAEYALALCLALARKVTLADQSLRQEVAGKLPIGTELGGKTVGILGFGDIGRRTARLFKAAFHTNILVFDPYVATASLVEVNAVRVDSIAELLPQCDVVVIHLPLTDATRNVIDTAEFALMRKTAFVINVARGGIVNETALYHALADAMIAGAASDVFDVEPVASSHPLLSLPNFIASPHIAASSRESLVRMGDATAKAVIETLAGRNPPNLVLPSYRFEKNLSAKELPYEDNPF